MFKHLLIPLDGSTLAESSLPMAAAIAAKERGKVSLLHIIEQDAPESVHGERHLTQVPEAEVYLDNIAQRYFPQLAVDRHVHSAPIKDVTRSIVHHCAEMGADVIVMSTHGKSGLKLVLFGCIAQHVVAQGSWPVLLTRARAANSAPTSATPAVRRVMVLLDGNPGHEEGLTAAAALARDLGCELALVMVVPTIDTVKGELGATRSFLPSATREMLELAEQDARAYLDSQLALPELQSLRVSSSVRRGDPVAMIAQAAGETKPDIVVLATHGAAGTTAFWRGSLTPKLIERLSATLLLIPVEE